MSDQGLPVTVAVTRPDGSIEHVRIGTAFRSGEGFTVRFADMQIGAAPARGDFEAPRRRAPVSSSGQGGDVAVFPNYGRSKGAPIHGASMQDLEYYAAGARRSLADPGKARWHDKERALLAAIEAEIARQRGEEPGGSDEPPPHSDEDAPF